MKKILLLVLISVQLFGQSKQKVIFDCDLGDDIDDAYALGLLLTMQDRYEILGITTCYGRTNDRAELAQKMLFETGQQHIPVYMGRNTSKENERANWYAEQFYWSKGFYQSHPEVPRNTLSAADFIQQKLNQFPGEVIIFSVGPVTNFGDIIDQDPQVLKKAKAIYAMFGSFRIGYNEKAPIDSEWNVLVDRPAAQKFVHSGAKIIYAGLDVTAMVKLDAANRLKLLQRQSVLTNALSALYVLWGQETPTLFDPVAIGMEAFPTMFKTEKVRITVDGNGFTHILPNGEPNAEIGIFIDKKAFVDQIMKKYVFQNFSRKP
jgi:purine nucleosidase